MPADHDRRIIAAIAAVKNGQMQKEAARLYGVAPSTLCDRLRGDLSRKQAHGKDRLFSTELEDQIVDWIHKSESAGRRPYRWEIVQFAQCLLKVNGRSQKIGGHWVDRLIQRHPSINKKPKEAVIVKSPVEEKPAAVV